MKKNLGKGTEMYEFFGDYYRFLSQFYEPEESEEYWEAMMNDTKRILEKYAACDFCSFARGLLVLTAVWLSDCRFKGNPKGNWNISYRQEGREYEQKQETKDKDLPSN